jgi:hypothetical protein
MYIEKQQGNYCRCHALNNLVGKPLISLKEFDIYCDEFDKKNHYDIGSSRNKYFFYNNGLTDNIFGYILQKKGFNIEMEHYDFYRPRKIRNCEKGTIGYIIYNTQHTWCVRVVDSEYWVIDSMKREVQKLNDLGSLERKGVGVILVKMNS